LTDLFPVSQTPSRAFPLLARLGLLGMAFGLLLDVVEHGVVSHADEHLVAGFPVGEHAAHFIVVVGMVLVLSGIVRDGLRASREERQRSSSNALR
jgi:H+/Cl- antiporter ClcA